MPTILIGITDEQFEGLIKIAQYVRRHPRGDKNKGPLDVAEDFVAKGIADSVFYTYYGGKWPDTPLLYQWMHEDDTPASSRFFRNDEDAEEWLRGISSVRRIGYRTFIYENEPEVGKLYLRPIYLAEKKISPPNLEGHA